MSDHDFEAEYAKSGRASCKACKNSIAKDSLRLAIMMQSPFFDGKVQNWYHFACFWKRAKVGNESEIHGFDSLRWDDQEKIRKNLGGAGGGGGGKAAMSAFYENYHTEYAKTSASTCRGCGDKIEKKLVRISKLDYESEQAKRYGPVKRWHHVDCFVDNREELEFTDEMDPTKITGYKSLAKEDQETVIEKLGKGKKRKSGAAKGAPPAKKSKEEKDEEKKLKDQSQALWKVRDALKKDVNNNALKLLLEYNKQDLPTGESKLLDRVAECMVFGALKPCKECKGQFVFSGTGNFYRCTGNMTEWTKCQETTQKPDRKAFKIPSEFHDVDILKKYKYVPRDRVFPKKAAAAPEAAAGESSSSKSSGKPLSNMNFVIIGKTNTPKKELQGAIEGMGGKLVTKVDKTVVACISTKDEVEKNSKQMKDAKKAGVHIVSESFVDKVKNGGAALFVTECSIASWGSDPVDRIGEDIPDATPSFTKSLGKSLVSKKDEKMFTKSVPNTLKMKVKGGAAVDPDSGLENTASVYQEKGLIYNAVLGMVDIVKGSNTYYKIQLLEAKNMFWVFRAWGRVGTSIGSNKIDKFASKANAIANFKAVYEEKTMNEFGINKDDFQKHPSKFYPIDIDYGEDEEVKHLDASAGSCSRLPKETQDLIKLIFDVESMKKTMLEFEIDLKKMPLGKLSKKQVQSAYKVLTELTELITKGGSATQFLDASNRFYTLIPHDFGMQKPPMLDNEEIIKSKTEMLANLLDIEVAYSLLKGGDGGGKDPIDEHYEKLNTKLDPMEKTTEEYQRLIDYVKNTHASTHNAYDLEVMDIFKVERDGEKKRYKPFKSLPNRKLLWHGSRTTNYAGILSQGLRIAPPEAPVTGYMFGKGVYFADMVSKSANYCRTSKTDPVGILILCEVACGKMYELTGAKYVTKLPPGTHSTKGVGMTMPDPAKAYTTPEGVEIPMGTSTSNPIQSSLLYNEYIVYDTAQINVKYLLKTNFKYKY